MTASLTFMMGEFPAEIPTDRRYARNHMWALQDGSVYRFGLSAYAVRLLQSVYFLDWHIDPGTQVAERQEIGQIESSKAESSLYSPVNGRLVELNEALLKDPSTINADKYSAGWMFSIETAGEQLLAPEEYLAHLESVWEVTQRTIKGQMNE